MIELVAVPVISASLLIACLGPYYLIFKRYQNDAPDWWSASFWTRLTSHGPWSIELVLVIALLLLPSGILIQILWLHSRGFCEGAMGSGVTCELGWLSGYFEFTNVLFEVSLLFLVGFAWGVANVALVPYGIYVLVRAVWDRAKG